MTKAESAGATLRFWMISALVSRQLAVSSACWLAQEERIEMTPSTDATTMIVHTTARRPKCAFLRGGAAAAVVVVGGESSGGSVVALMSRFPRRGLPPPARRARRTWRRASSWRRRRRPVLVPVDLGDVGSIEHLRAARGREVVPSPGHERVDPVAHAEHERGVHAEPGGEGDDAVQLVAVRADLGDGGAAADHRHDALVVVVERLGVIAARDGADVVRRPRAALERDGAEPGQRVAVRP